MGGCGKPGHVTAGSDEGTRWCATCVNEGDASPPYHVREEIYVYIGDYRIATCRTYSDAREIADGMNATVALRKRLNAWEPLIEDAEEVLTKCKGEGMYFPRFEGRIRALKAQKAPLSRGVER